MPIKPRFHAIVERILPWYDQSKERERDLATEALRRRAIAARVNLEQIKRDYIEAGRASRRRR